MPRHRSISIRNVLAITRVDLTVEGAVPDIGEDEFLDPAEGAKEECPVSKALAGTEIELSATLLK